MKTTEQKGVRRLILRLVISILLVFTLLGTVLGTIGTYALGSPSLLLSQLEKQDAAQKVHSSLQTKFETQYNTTAVPAEVYMEVLTTQWLDNIMKEQVEAAYTQMHESGEQVMIDFTPLEDAITAYFEQFAEENNYEKDDTYTQKLTEIKENAEDTVQNAIDVYHIGIMQKAGVFDKLSTLFRMSLVVAIGCGVVSIALILWLCLLRDRACYWIGTSLFAGGALLTVAGAVIFGTSVIQKFSLKDPAVYAVFTGTMTFLTQVVLGLGLVLLAAGLILWCGNVFFVKSRRKSA